MLRWHCRSTYKASEAHLMHSLLASVALIISVWLMSEQRLLTLTFADCRWMLPATRVAIATEVSQKQEDARWLFDSLELHLLELAEATDHRNSDTYHEQQRPKPENIDQGLFEGLQNNIIFLARGHTNGKLV